MDYLKKNNFISLEEHIEPCHESQEVRITKEPVLSDYGLTPQAIAENSQIRLKQKTNIKWTSGIIALAILGLVTYRPSDSPLNFIGFILSLCYGSFYLGSGIYQILDSVFLKKPNLSESYLEEYERDLKQYKIEIARFKYWQQKKKKDFWLNLTGHQFEEALAKVYRKNGYIANVTQGSGDGGVDIILEKNNVITYVQCKAHKKAVGPAVARELYGTMKHSSVQNGIIASLGGFTKGVYDFVDDKAIDLIDLEDIIRLAQ